MKKKKWFKKYLQVRPNQTAAETYRKPCSWGFALAWCHWGGKPQEGEKCWKSFPSERAQVQTYCKIKLKKKKYICELAGVPPTSVLCHGWKLYLGFWKTGFNLLSILKLCPGSLLWGLQDDPPQVVLQQGHRSLPKERVSQRALKLTNTNLIYYEFPVHTHRLPEQAGGAVGKPKSTQLNTSIPHIFEKHTYHRPTFCQHCGKMLFGLYHQGYRCRNHNCGLDVHEGCQEVWTLFLLFK